jgi:hypothetical protein
MTVSEAQRLKDLEQENNNLKRLLAALTLVIIGSRTRTLKGNSLRAVSEATDLPTVAPALAPPPLEPARNEGCLTESACRPPRPVT